MVRAGRWLTLVVVLALFIGAPIACRVGSASGSSKSKKAPVPGSSGPLAFERADLHLELNEVEGDISLIVDAAATAPLSRIKVISPDGCVIVDQQAGKGCPTAADEVRVQATQQDGHVFPEGTYTIEAVAFDGTRLAATASLLFDFLPGTEVLPEFEEAVHPDQVEIFWTPVPEAESYVVEIEFEEIKIFSVTVLASSSSLVVPAGVLLEGASYEVTIQVVSPDGNVTESDGEFETGSR